MNTNNSREKEIAHAAESEYFSTKAEEFAWIHGAEWADQHPRKGLWDANKVCKYLEEHASNYITLENDEEGELQTVFYQRQLIKDLRKAMEE